MSKLGEPALYTPAEKVARTRPFGDQAARSFTIPAHYYYDPDLYRAEMDRVFGRSWVYVDHVEKLRDPGDYVTAMVGDQNILTIRGKDGVLRAFYNVCQHRGHELLKGSGKKAKVITCPYHAWSFHADGRLRSARGAETMEDFDATAFSLKEVKVEIFCNLVFVNLDPNAPSFKSQLGDLEQEIRSYLPDLDKLTFARRYTYDIKANWKNTIDNFLECYHCKPTHPAFAELVDLSTYCSTPYGIYSSHIGKTGRGDNAAYKFEASDKDPGFAAWWIWPDLALVVNPGCPNLFVFHAAPGGPERTAEVIDFYFMSNEPSEVEVASMDYFDNILNPEDIGIVESVQRGLHSRGYNQGRYVVDKTRTDYNEGAVHHFHGLVLKALGHR